MADGASDGGAPDGASSRRPLLDLLGLAARAGGLVYGTDAVRRAAREDRVHWVALAEDAAPAQRGKLTPLLSARGVPCHTKFTRAVLGAAVGRAPVAAIGITNQNFARRAGELVSSPPTGRSATELRPPRSGTEQGGS